MKLLLFIIFFFIIFFPKIIAQQSEEKYINIQRGIYQRIKIYISSDRKVSKDIVKLIKKNFLYSGVFKEEKKNKSNIFIHILLGNENDYIINFFSKNNTPLLKFLLKKKKNKTFKEREVIKFVQKAVLELTKKKSSLGSAIVYAEKKGKEPTKIVMIDTHNTKKITFIKNEEYNILPKWSPKENALLYTSLSHKGSRIFHLDLKKRSYKVFIHSKVGTATGGSWNPQNNDIVVTLSNPVNHDLYLFKENGILKKKLTKLSSIETSPSFAPDGKSLVFVSNRSGSLQLYYLDLVENKQTRLTFMGNYNADPDWNNDGTHLLYSGQKNGVFQVYLMDFYGNKIKQLTYAKNTSENPSWSPDDRLLVFSSKVSGESKLYIMTIDGKYIRRLTRSPKGVKEFNPDWASSKPWGYFK